jgi:outer membrane murein-binding lipoprotein Lpp
MGIIMSLIQLPKVIEAVNELALKVQKLEIQVQSLLNDKNNAKESKPSTAKKPA